LIVLDGMPLYSDEYSYVNTLPTNAITSLTILESKQGYSLYGPAAKDGMIFINTRLNDTPQMKSSSEWNGQLSNDKMLTLINIYRPIIEFYNPTKEEADADPGIQNRSTIFWKPEIYFDGKEPVKITYPNLSVPGPVLITINGVSFDNLAGTGKARYLVQMK
jgi:hypothetical protein